MHTRIHLPERLGPDDLDRYLRDGWYRIGQHMVTCRFVWSSDEVLRSAIWTRTRLHDFRFTGSNRRLMRRNHARYTVTEGPLRLDEEREALYARYLTVARGERPKSLNETLLAGHELDRFTTRELAVRTPDGQLVALSLFDQGEEGLQSLLGAYDPAHARHGLGYWTLLLEVEHALSRGLAYHYAGYVMPGDPSMDYKLRVGNMEFLHPEHRTWVPWSTFPELELPSLRLETRLTAVSQALAAKEVPAVVRSYRMYEAYAWNPELERALREPRVVLLDPERTRGALDVVVWSDKDRRYEVVRCTRARTWAEHQGEAVEVELWLENDRRAAGDDPEAVAQGIAFWRSLLA